MSDLDRGRAARLMAAGGLDGLVLTKPEHVAYAIGAGPGVATMWRRAGGAVAIVPADPARRVVAIVGDLNAPAIARQAPDVDVVTHRIWVDAVDLSGLEDPDGDLSAYVSAGYRRQWVDGAPPAPRPATFSLASVLRLLDGELGRLGLGQARLGLDLDFLPHADYLALTSVLSGPRWSNGSTVVGRLRAIKSPREIGWLRQASALAEAGLIQLQSHIRPGATARDLSAAWSEGVNAEILRLGLTNVTGRWDYISVGSDPWGGGGVVAPGALIKADVGTLVAGYSSDGARSFVCGEPDGRARKIHDVLLEAHAVGTAAIRPGATFGDVYEATAAVFARRAFSGYDRGHFGHSVGADVGPEEWPFLARGETEIIEPGMVLAFEVPFYANGLGALMIEDQLLVTEAGIEMMTTLPRELIVVD